jgi:PEP-CTERM motif
MQQKTAQELLAGHGHVSLLVSVRVILPAPADIAFGPNGLLYVAATNALYRFDVSGASGLLVDSFGTGGQFLAFTPSVPEPGTWAFMAAGLAVIACYRLLSATRVAVKFSGTRLS